MLRALAAKKTLTEAATSARVHAPPTTLLERASSSMKTSEISDPKVKTLTTASAKTLISTTSTAAKPGAIPKFASSSGGFFNQIKNEERRFSRKRLRLPYDENITGALALPYTTAQLSEQHQNTAAQFTMFRQFIIEHASRRVDLFFYTLIAYYNTKLKPMEGHTSLQHGCGRTLEDDTNLTQACHSSFTPSLIDETIDRKTDKRNLLSGTHLFESLNSTVELPPFVNAFDNILEAICRPRCIDILQRVAAGELNPIQGLNSFLQMMNTVLSDFAEQANEPRYSGLSHSAFSKSTHYVNPKLIELVRIGTLQSSFMEERGVVNPDYLHLLLMLNRDEKAVCYGSAPKREKFYAKKCAELQAITLSSERMDYSPTP